MSRRTHSIRVWREARNALLAVSPLLDNKAGLFSKKEILQAQVRARKLNLLMQDRNASADALLDALSALDHAINTLAENRVLALKAKIRKVYDGNSNNTSSRHKSATRATASR